jgi:hypothetical protein
LQQTHAALDAQQLTPDNAGAFSDRTRSPRNPTQKSMAMPGGGKSKYTDMQKREAAGRK